MNNSNIYSPAEVMCAIVGADKTVCKNGNVADRLVRQVIGLDSNEPVNEEARIVVASYLISSFECLRAVPINEYTKLAHATAEKFKEAWAIDSKDHRLPKFFKVRPIGVGANEYMASLYVKAITKTPGSRLEKDPYYVGEFSECHAARQAFLNAPQL